MLFFTTYITAALVIVLINRASLNYNVITAYSYMVSL
jgi:hypothetical protein